MFPDKSFFDQLNTLFNPESVAIVGLPREMKTGKLFLISLLDLDFKGTIYPVNPKTHEIDGLRTYPSVSAIPGKVDLAILLIPASHTKAVLMECAQKKVKGVVLFTAGYKETGSIEGAALEKELLAIARTSGMRLIGPNAMGLYNPKSGISFFPGLSKTSGSASLISHSGSLANLVCREGPNRGIFFNKAVSVGNECDLSSADFLDFFANDPEIGFIGSYIEGIKDKSGFFLSLKRASLKKPVIIWKMGLTSFGAKAANSHTGALSGDPIIWKGIVSQTGAISVFGFEQWLDAFMGFSLYPQNIGKRVAIISGPGAFGVSASEACGYEGLTLAELSSSTRETLKKIIPETGTSVSNPIDVGLTASLDIRFYREALQAALQDENVDAAFIIGIGLSEELNEEYVRSIITLYHEFKKPISVISMPGFEKKHEQELCRKGVPVFSSGERAMKTYAMVYSYWLWRRGKR
ncbi:CoA-binding protein [bacterium]|nr:CoA-binding protein [bacterium]